MPKLSPYDGVALNGRALYTCDNPDCTSKRVPWSKGWMHYSSIRDQEDDPCGFPTFCCDDCAMAYRDWQVSNGETKIIPVPPKFKNSNPKREKP